MQYVPSHNQLLVWAKLCIRHGVLARQVGCCLDRPAAATSSESILRQWKCQPFVLHEHPMVGPLSHHLRLGGLRTHCSHGRGYPVYAQEEEEEYPTCVCTYPSFSFLMFHSFTVPSVARESSFLPLRVNCKQDTCITTVSRD